jgi:hypothetical protein
MQGCTMSLLGNVIGRRLYSNAASSSSIFASMLLQRNPIIMQPLTELEVEYGKYRESLQADFSKGTFQLVMDKAHAAETTAPRKPHLGKELLIDEADTSLSRQLHRKLFLIIQEKGSGEWRLPRMQHQEEHDGPLHETARKALEDAVGTSCEVHQVGRSPLGHCRLSNKEDEFIFKSQLLAGDVVINSASIASYKWANKEEAQQLLGSLFNAAADSILSD